MSFNEEFVAGAKAYAMQGFAEKYPGERNRRIADGVSDLTLKYLEFVPIGWNINSTKEDYYKNCYQFVKDNYDSRSTVGFVGSFLLWWLIEAIIKYIVRRLIEHFWDNQF